MIEIWRILLKHKWKASSFKDGFVQSAVLNYVLRESPKLWNLHCGRLPKEKLAVRLLNRVERSGLHVCPCPGMALLTTKQPEGSSSAVTGDLPTQDIIRVPQDVSILILCAKKSWNENTRSKCKRLAYWKKTIWFGSALSGSFQTNSACILKRSQPRKIIFFQVHASLATINS